MLLKVWVKHWIKYRFVRGPGRHSAYLLKRDNYQIHKKNMEIFVLQAACKLACMLAREKCSPQAKGTFDALPWGGLLECPPPTRMVLLQTTALLVEAPSILVREFYSHEDFLHVPQNSRIQAFTCVQEFLPWAQINLVVQTRREAVQNYNLSRLF